MTNATSAPGWPVIKGVQNTKEISCVNMKSQTAARQLDKLWSDDFLTNAGIYAAGSAAYTYQGTPNFNVVRDTSTAINQQQLTDNGAYTSPGAGNYRGQIFTPNATVNIGSITIMAKKNGSTTGNMICKIYATAAGVPTGAALASSSVIDSATLGGTHAEIVFSFTGANAIQLTSGTPYAFSIEDSGAVNWNGATDYPDYGLNTAGGYAGGTGLLSGDAGANWSVDAGQDMYFKFTTSAALTASVVSVRALDLAANVTQAIMFADVTLGTGTAAYYISTNDGSTWTAVTLETLASVPAGQQIRIKVELTGDAALNSWGVAV